MVSGTRKENLVAVMQAGAHTILADVSTKLGGTDLAANPHELLEAALAACTITTVQMYANRKNWPLVSTNVVVTIDKEGPESRKISFTGELSSEQTSRLMEIADKCPIHKLLTSKIEISTQPLD
jgi:putative redox protein